MIPPKIDICIEGYNIEQTDFYIAHIIDKYNSLNELYQKSCEHIVFLEKECKSGFNAALSDVEKRIIDKLESFDKRISEIENKIDINADNNEIINNDSDLSDMDDEKLMAELSDFQSTLEDIKSLFKNNK